MTDTAVFMDALYGMKPDGSVIVISHKNGDGWGASQFPNTAADACAHVAGTVDAYTRISVIGKRPTKGRGTAADSVAIPGVWVEVDRNGAPDGNGGVITGAFDSIDAGLHLAGRIVPLTMAACSGYGGHGYALFPEPWILEGDEDRAAAKALVQRYQAAVRKLAAAELGVDKLDSTHDLARVFRPPGSLNSKGERPVPVELLFSDGPRIARADLDALLPVLEARGKNGKRRKTSAGAKTTEDAVTDDAVKKIVADDAMIARIVKRTKKKAPGDGSASAWDFYLACEAMRRRHTDDEAAALIRHARALHGESKGERNDYIEKTVTEARRKVAEPAPGEGDRDETCQAITKTYGITTNPIVGGYLVGRGEGAIVHVIRKDETDVRLGHVHELFDPRRHTLIASVSFKTAFTALTGATATKVTQWLLAVCDEDDGDYDVEMAPILAVEFATNAGATVLVGDMSKSGEQWRALAKSKQEEKDLAANRGTVARCAVLLGRSDGRAWIPAGAFRASLGPGVPSWRDVNSVMAEAGWERRRLDVHRPNGDCSPPRDVHHIARVFYIEPKGTAS